MFVHSIATLVPETSYPQDVVGNIMQRGIDKSSKAARLLRRIYAHSDIEKRHSVVSDYALREEGLFLASDLETLKMPTTRERNERYTREARDLFGGVAKAVIDQAEGIERSDITHVITVSCTGFYAPGPDFYIVKDLGLRPNTRRTHVGFMGCYAGFPALRLARSISVEDPEAVILVVSVELCTLHMQPTENIDKIIATSVFADGAGAALISAREPATGRSAFRLDAFETTISPGSEDDMAWKIGDHGFDMVLSTYVPRIIGANVLDVVHSMLASSGYSIENINHWAIHPGGKAILDKVSEGLQLEDDALDVPRSVLRQYGNMSSATIFFVLKEFQQRGMNVDDSTFALAFGPGLTIESALLTVV